MNTIFKNQKIFLVDAIGAGVSIFSLFIPYTFEEFFGMPQSSIVIFISIAIVCFIYSTSVYLSKTPNWKFFLMIIALLNISYCIFTLYHIIIHRSVLTMYGYVYFISEILIIFTLAMYELKLSRKSTN